MRIHCVSNNTPSFGNFRVKDRGAQCLAQTFVNHPELEARFMLKIAKPLEKCEGDVIFDGYQASYKHSMDKSGGSVVLSEHGEKVLAVVAENYSRNAYRRVSNVKPTNDFQDYYPLNEIESAKNIIVDKDSYYNKIAAAKYTEAYKNETVTEKAERLERRFGINA